MRLVDIDKFKNVIDLNFASETLKLELFQLANMQETVNPLNEVLDKLNVELRRVMSNASIDDVWHGDELDGLNRALRIVREVNKEYE